ncbi:hypothetical protein ACH95_11930 [Bacillus glycinifermentans]|uniref:Uncharacterized protein n=1 Tax=Bacillus glycinifermentans TaxID=1664069 RepID=A0A0J6E974_9BACI|nr:hypothetical protein [Bacillus glycinifermentans]ATH93603.1 hypothetical protein COP00_14035 [Bacillus glycinifermentans]KMM59157.1 hypothetical protein ACH95_11930 [Bacillus glycinifermentans]KRT90224.1 hypothetical protein AB447_206490 [Bacillus glycinifermentans]MEC0483914.1 hypothetical protein [Bacillus glycinifermentans]MEC0496410.1 hypothetical protein [Bacillus glycinifermentans]
MLSKYKAEMMETDRIDVENGFFISATKDNLDMDRICRFLSEQSYRAKGIIRAGHGNDPEHAALLRAV